VSAAAAWARYDAVAEAYERFVAANGYAALAKDLVARLNLPHGASVLDLGCGPGTAALAAQEAVGAAGLVVGLDISLAMLRRAAARGVALVVSGAAPRLPFRDRLFDGVAASLVLSHLEPYDVALRDMVAILKPGGRLGITAWADGKPEEFRRLWKETAHDFVSEDMLRGAASHVAPWEEWFTDAAHVTEALAAAGLKSIEVVQKEYPVSISTDDYVVMSEVFTYGRFLRSMLGAAQWHKFKERVAETLRGRVGQRVEYTGRAHLAVGRKPWSASRARTRLDVMDALGSA